MTTFFIATKHACYAEHSFPAGSTVIDPWRYIPDQRGVSVRRLGENKPALISILCPTRQRPNEFKRMLTSAREHATFPDRVECLAYRDADDAYPYADLPGVTYIRGERILLAEMWNVCYRQAKGEIVMHCGDDIVFRTPGWDALVRRAFAASEDKILVVHGDDCSPNSDLLATHGFYHRRWVETVGYLTPPLFSSDWCDVWLTEVADMIGRRKKLPFVTDHMHYSFGKAAIDQNTRDREQRGHKDDVVRLYQETLNQRRKDAKKLLQVLV